MNDAFWFTIVEAIAVALIIVAVIRLIVLHSRVNCQNDMTERFTARYIQEQRDTRFDDAPHLAFPTKCFSCEKDFMSRDAWRAQPTRCFSCEHHSPYPQYTHPSRCLSCASTSFMNIPSVAV
jgi:hypothetical protein